MNKQDLTKLLEEIESIRYKMMSLAAEAALTSIQRHDLDKQIDRMFQLIQKIKEM